MADDKHSINRDLFEDDPSAQVLPSTPGADGEFPAGRDRTSTDSFSMKPRNHLHALHDPLR